MTDVALDTPLMDAAQAAALLNVPPSTVMDLARRAVLPSIKVGRHRRFLRADLEAWLRDQRAVA